jgi:hypothetical protein
MLPGAVDAWLADVDAASGGTADTALVRLGPAVMRGLLLDLVATEDHAGVWTRRPRRSAISSGSQMGQRDSINRWRDWQRVLIRTVQYSSDGSPIDLDRAQHTDYLFDLSCRRRSSVAVGSVGLSVEPIRFGCSMPSI